MKYLIIIFLLCPTLVLAQDVTSSVQKAKETCQAEVTQATADIAVWRDNLDQAQAKLAQATSCLDNANKALPEAVQADNAMSSNEVSQISP